MKLKTLVEKLDKEFEVATVKDEWQWLFDEDFIKNSLPKFRKSMHHTGLAIKNSEDIKIIYAAFAPSTYVLQQVKKKGIKNSLLVVKHPFDWDGSPTGQGFIKLSKDDYAIMKEMNVNLYSLHTPMDKNRNDELVSTAHAFAKVIGLEVEQEFASEGPRNPELLLGLIGKVKDKTFDALTKRLSEQLNYEVKTIKRNNILGKVAIVTGGGFVPEIIREAKNKGVNTYITGIITPNASDFSKATFTPAHAEIKKIDINIIGASHYLTEKWAMQYSVDFFSKYCKTEFIEDKDALKKLE